MFKKDSLEKFFNLKFDNWIFFIPFFGLNSYYKLFDLLVEYESVEKGLYHKIRLISAFFYLILNLFSVFLCASLFLLIFIYKVPFFSLGKNFIFSVENKSRFLIDYNIWFPNFINVLIYSVIAFFGFFLNAFWAKFVISLLKKYFFRKYNMENTAKSFEFLQNFDLKFFVNSVLVDTENCKADKKSRKICWKYQHWFMRSINIRQKIPLEDNLFFIRHFTRFYYISLRNRKEISEFDWLVIEVQNYYSFYTIIFSCVFNREQKDFNRKRFFFLLFKILFFYLLTIWVFIFATIFLLYNDFHILHDRTFLLRIAAIIATVLVFFVINDLLKEIFTEWAYRRIKKRFFDPAN